MERVVMMVMGCDCFKVGAGENSSWLLGAQTEGLLEPVLSTFLDTKMPYAVGHFLWCKAPP